jgi:hypothetical protein
LHLDDVPEFKDACVAWAPYVAKYKNSPRALKRFLNKVRYLATFHVLRDSSLVALAAIEYLQPAALANARELDALSTAPHIDTLAQAVQDGFTSTGNYHFPGPRLMRNCAASRRSAQACASRKSTTRLKQLNAGG